MVNHLNFKNICHKISNIYNNKEQVSLEELEGLFVNFIEQLFMNIFNIDRKPIVEFTDNDLFHGCYNGLISIDINRQLLKSFQEGKALELFETIAHEFQHFNQKREYQNINIRNSIIEKR